jgi:agmatinase
MKGYGPADPLQTPRFAGISTFLRLPHTTHLDGVDVAFVGLPFDTGVSFRAGARFGPKAIREGSLSLRPAYNMAQRVAVFDKVSAIDYGDSGVVPGFTERSYERMVASLQPICEAGAVPIGFGGDHSVLLAELRAVAATHGPVALVQFDAHSDTWDEYFGEKYTHGTVVRRAVEEGLIDPKRSTLMGMRGGLYAPDDLDQARDMEFTVLPWEDLAHLGTGAVAAAVDRATGKSFLTFDIDFVDPAFAPGTGTPECGGPTSMQALSLLRACRGLHIVGADVVEVLPDLDSSHLTGTLAATVAWEILSLIAAEWPAEEGAPS